MKKRICIVRNTLVALLLLLAGIVMTGCKKKVIATEEASTAIGEQLTLVAEEGAEWSIEDATIGELSFGENFPGLAYVVGLKAGTTKVTAEGKEKITEFTVTVSSSTPVAINISCTYGGSAYISYVQDTPYNAPNGVTYQKGDLLPTWVEYGKVTNVAFTDVTPQGGKKEADILKEAAADGFTSADLYNGKVSDLNNYGTQGYFVDLMDYIDRMPNLKAFLEQNQAIMLSLEGADGGVYYAPYFDGMDEVERSIYLRHDWVQKLLDTDATYDTGKVIDTKYSAFYKDEFKNGVTLKGTTADVTKKYSESQNIVTIQNALSTKNGKTLTEALKQYIDDVYGSQIGSGKPFAKRSDLFLSGNAAYDADELIALMRCVKANPALLTGNAATDIAVYMPRDTGSSRIPLIINIASIWGLRGMNGENNYYIDENGDYQNAMGEEETFVALQWMNQLYQEGLILQNYDTKAGSVSDWRGVLMYTQGTGFMTIDYNQTTTALYDSKTLKTTVADNPGIAGLDIRAVLPPVADWEDGEEDNYIRFSEFIRAVKTEGWGISKAVEADPAKLAACLKVVDYAYSDAGEVLVTWGPKEWIDGEIEYQGVDGVEMIPNISAQARQEITDLVSGNLTNYYRRYVGSTFAIGHVRHMGFEYQILNEHGLESVKLINEAIAAGAMHITKTAYDAEKGWFFLTPPSSWALSDTEIEQNKTEASNATAVFNDNKHNLIMIGAGNTSTDGTVKMPTWTEFKASLTTNKYYSVHFENYKSAWNRMKMKHLSE